MKKILFALFTLSALLLVGCQSTPDFNRDENTIKEDLTTALPLTSDTTVTSFKIEDKATKEDITEVLVDFSIESLKKNGGSLNKDLKKNHLVSRITGQVSLIYKLFEKDWRFYSIENYKELSRESSEIDNLIERIPFNKAAEEILKDLTTQKVGIKVNGNHVHTITFGENKTLGYRTIDKVNEFTILESKTNDGSDLLLNVICYLDGDYKVTESIFQDNGEYNAKGTFNILYRLKEDTNEVAFWEIESINNINPQISSTLIR